MLRFTKMHGLGNDFIIIDAIHQTVNISSSQIAALADRDTGIGFDQCLLVEQSSKSNIDFYYRIFNADGQEVGQCGNGARCLARFVEYYKLTNKKEIIVETKTTTMKLKINPDDSVTVTMPAPKLSPKDIPIKTDEQQALYNLDLDQKVDSNAKSIFKFHAIEVGNPHAICIVPNVKSANVNDLGKTISTHPFFPQQTNVGFMEIADAEHIKLRVYERGVGETKACGSGAVAAMAVGRLFHHLNYEVTVQLTGGQLIVHWEGNQHPIYLTGPATFVYEGRLLS